MSGNILVRASFWRVYHVTEAGQLDWFGIVWIYGISTIISYLMRNFIFTNKINIWFVRAFY